MQRPAEPELVINLKAAELLSITLPSGSIFIAEKAIK
jgi:hypothetical protein